MNAKEIIRITLLGLPFIIISPFIWLFTNGTTYRETLDDIFDLFRDDGGAGSY